MICFNFSFVKAEADVKLSWCKLFYRYNLYCRPSWRSDFWTIHFSHIWYCYCNSLQNWNAQGKSL